LISIFWISFFFSTFSFSVRIFEYCHLLLHLRILLEYCLPPPFLSFLLLLCEYSLILILIYLLHIVSFPLRFLHEYRLFSFLPLCVNFHGDKGAETWSWQLPLVPSRGF
jgi:hypothetical protein